MRIKISAAKLPGALHRRHAGIATAIAEGLEIGAERARTWLVMKSPYDRGTLAAAWKVEVKNRHLAKKNGKRSRKYEALRIFNDAPYASAVELGARPYLMGRKGIDGLTGWARRKFGVSEKEARGIAFGIRHKLKMKGRKGTYFVRDSVDEIGDMTMKEIMRRLSRLATTKEPR